MKSIKEVSKLINCLPVDKQNTRASYANWFEGTPSFLDKKYEPLFRRNGDTINITRAEIIKEGNIEYKIIETILWGYPTKGRGRNIASILQNIVNLTVVCESIVNEDFTETEYFEIIDYFKQIKGLGPSTWTKLFYFMNVSINGYRCQIFDRQIERSLASPQFCELASLAELTHNDPKDYIQYIRGIQEVANILGTESENIELFLFYFNNNYHF